MTKQTSIIIYLILSSCTLFAQVKTDTTINKICINRGHVASKVISTTSMYCESYVIDTDSTTIIVQPSCNFEWFKCKRCGKQVAQKEKEQRIIIYKLKE